jgi:hypothetical protein
MLSAIKVFMASSVPNPPVSPSGQPKAPGARQTTDRLLN